MGVGAAVFLLPGGVCVLPYAHMGRGLAPELGFDGGGSKLFVRLTGQLGLYISPPRPAGNLPGS